MKMPQKNPVADTDCEKAEWRKWSVDTVIQKLKVHGISDRVVQAFTDADCIQGKHLEMLKFDYYMEKLKLSFAECQEIKSFLLKENIWSAPSIQNFKIFNDPIHGNIQLHPVCLAVIDTPEFQRLRDIKQLGMCYFVYPGAAHNRFEHSLGVCYLAGLFVQTLRANQPELGIDDSDVLCVQLAGLCHDIGHGPYSHLFDTRFIPAVDKNASGWKHEQASKEMFELICKNHGLLKKDGIFTKYGLTERDMSFVTELMAGPSNRGNAGWPYKGRDKSKAYLFEIVANKRNSIDVDKWDYIARDCYQLGIRSNFDHTRFTKFARVNEVDGEMQICVRDKEMVNLYNMFFTRYILHKHAYQHKVNCALDIMVEQALIKANNHIRIKGENGYCKISDCIRDMTAYTHLTDNILYKILHTESSQNDASDRSTEEDNQELQAAKHIVERIFERDLFKCIAETNPLEPEVLEGKTDESIKEEILKLANSGHITVTKDDFFIQIVDLDFGMKDENPVEKLNTFSKSKPDEARNLPRQETSRILAPYTCKEQLLRVYIANRTKTYADDKTKAEADDKTKAKNEAIKKAWETFLNQVLEARAQELEQQQLEQQQQSDQQQQQSKL